MRRSRFSVKWQFASLASLAVVPGVAMTSGFTGHSVTSRVSLDVGSRYHVTEIPLRYGLSTDQLSINDSGDVCGTCQNHENSYRGDCAFLYHDGIVTDIRTTDDNRTEAVGLNNLGQVLVYRRNLKGIDAPFVWSGGQFAPLGGLPKGFAVSNRGYVAFVPVGECKVCSINNSGDVAGFLEQGELPIDGVPEVRPFRWHNGFFTLATESRQPGTNSVSIALPTYPTILEDGAFNFQAQAMNDSGDIVGDTPGGGFVGSGRAVVVWKNGQGRVIQVVDGRSTLGPKPTSAPEGHGIADMLVPRALNNRAAWSGTHSGIDGRMGRLREAFSHYKLGGNACLWTDEDTGVQDLSEKFEILADDVAVQQKPISSDAYGMNDKTEIVGEIDEIVNTPRTGTRLDERACLWRDGKAYDLNSMIDQQKNCHLSRAWSINNSGQIIAAGPRVDFRDPVYRHAYWLKPVKE